MWITGGGFHGVSKRDELDGGMRRYEFGAVFIAVRNAVCVKNCQSAMQMIAGHWRRVGPLASGPTCQA